MPALPGALKQLLEERYSFSDEDTSFLTDSVELLNFFDQAMARSNHPNNLLNWLKGPIQSLLKEQNIPISELQISPEQVGKLADLTANGLSFSVAVQKLLPVLLSSPQDDPKKVAENLGLLKSHDEESLEPIVLDILKEFPEKVTAYKNGKKGLIGFFMGQLMKKTESKIDPRIANELLVKYLN